MIKIPAVNRGFPMTKTIRILFLLAAFVQSLHANDERHVVLTMIVKNESRIIERMLDSVQNVVDGISICDTGSTDNTVEVIERYMKEHNLPGKVHYHPWKNFGYNRTMSVELAKKTVEELGLPLENTYLLLLDADMLLEVHPQFNKRHLNADSYLVTQKSTVHTYDNTRLIRASLPWKCVGVTHEYWDCKEAKSMGRLQTVSIDDKNDGGCKSDKFERDIRLLTQGLVDEPDNVRYMFYLAQSYKDTKQHDKASTWYQKRIEAGGWYEEVWYSKLMLGDMNLADGNWNKALEYYLDAFQYNPKRAEPLYKIAHYYRNKGDKELGYIFAKRASQISFPHDQLLFVYHNVYDYQIDEELSIVSDRTPFKHDGLLAANRLLLKRSVPDYIKNQTHKNLIFYVENLPNTHIHPLHLELPFIREGLNIRYNLMHSSIQKNDTGYTLICRAVNYLQKGAVSHWSQDPEDKTIRTKNYLVELDKNFKLLSQKEIVDKTTFNPTWWVRFEGHEDCRLFNFKNEPHYICTTANTHPDNVCQSLGKISPDCTVNTLVPLHGPDPKRCEKNWLPIVQDDNLFVLYSYDPITILQINPETGATTPSKVITPKYDFSRFRGSAAPIAFDDGYLVLVHEVVWTGERIYLHRFLQLDKNFNITKASLPFTFQHQGVEYCCGMTLDHAGKNLVMPISLEDASGYIYTLDVERVRAILDPLNF